MKRVPWIVLALLLTGPTSACDAPDSSYMSAGWGWHHRENCDLHESCGSCTPVVGCGWCTGPTGAGVCVADPDDCPTQEFTWTWDPSGCRTAADASVSEPPDAGPPLASPLYDGASMSVGDIESMEATDAYSEETLQEASGAPAPCVSSSADAGDVDATPCD